MLRNLRFNLVDVFTHAPLTGNQLAVFTQAEGLSDDLMLAIARETNLSETVFLQRPQEGGHARLRIFTPRAELPFAGHPVLGAAWVLGGPLETGKLRLETGRGMVEVDLERAGDRLHAAWMEQPLPSYEVAEDAAPIVEALGLGAVAPLRTPVVADNGPRHLLIELDPGAALSELRVDQRELARVCTMGVYVVRREEDRAWARYFAPCWGIEEDAATGSACGALVGHLVRSGAFASGAQLEVRQGAEMGRPSLLLARAVASENRLTSVRVGGSAVVVGRGELSV